MTSSDAADSPRRAYREDTIMSEDALFIVVIGAAGVIGLLVRRWWLLAALAVAWLAFIGFQALTGGLEDDHDFTPINFAAWLTIFGFLPIELAAAAGTLIGRFIRRPTPRTQRGRRVHEHPA